MKKWSAGKIIGIVLLTLVVLIIAGVAALFLLFPPQKIKSLVIPPVEKALGRTVEIKKAGFTLFPNIGVSLSGVEISNTTRRVFFRSLCRLEGVQYQHQCCIDFPRTSGDWENSHFGPQILLETDSAGSFNYADIESS